ncbi:MAG: ATP-binding protein [Polyangiaceae bacterium]|nr:ATP-binding protein [Polyangiaceae bacterium]
MMKENETAERLEFDRLINRAAQHQADLRLTNSQFATRYAAYVGSHKSWEHRLLPRKWDELKPATWLPKLRKFVALLDGASQDLDIFSTLPIVRHAEYLYETLQSRTNDRRCAMLIGTQGTGKSMALRHVQRSNKFAPVFVSANETWKDSRMRIATALATAVNASVSTSASGTFQTVVENLKASPITLLIDEAHEGGVLLMKLVKTIINETQSRIMLAVYPTAWNRLINGANDAYAEAQQLLRRTWRPVKPDWLAGINEPDLEAWAKAVELPALKARAADLLPRVRKHGNFSLLADALERSRLIADEAETELTPDLFCAQIHELCGGKP